MSTLSTLINVLYMYGFEVFLFFSPVIDIGGLYMYLFYQDYVISSIIITFLLCFANFRIRTE